MEPDGCGRVILLNGASSSGKSSIGRALQGVMADPWFLFPVDSLGAMRSTDHRRALGEGEIQAMLRRTRLGYHRAVDVRCDPEELERRERARGDRPPGLGSTGSGDTDPDGFLC